MDERLAKQLFYGYVTTGARRQGQIPLNTNTVKNTAQRLRTGPKICGLRDSSDGHGMTTTLSGQADSVLLAWEPVNGQMAYVRLKSHFTNISIVSVYAPTSNAEQRDKKGVLLAFAVDVQQHRPHIHCVLRLVLEDTPPVGYSQP
nr:unnamed protein product [Spirometra erinaceieuropaei]